MFAEIEEFIGEGPIAGSSSVHGSSSSLDTALEAYKRYLSCLKIQIHYCFGEIMTHYPPLFCHSFPWLPPFLLCQPLKQFVNASSKLEDKFSQAQDFACLAPGFSQY